MEVTGVLLTGESTAAFAHIGNRRGLSLRWTKLILLAPVLAVGIPVGAWASGSWFAATVSVEFALVGLGLGMIVCRLLAGPAARRAWAERGQPYEHNLTIRLTPDAVVYDLGHLVLTAQWSCVTDLFRTRTHWVMLMQGTPAVLPRRFFATPEAESIFIADFVSRMTEAAKARSPDAIAVAARDAG